MRRVAAAVPFSRSFLSKTRYTAARTRVSEEGDHQRDGEGDGGGDLEGNGAYGTGHSAARDQIRVQLEGQTGYGGSIDAIGGFWNWIWSEDEPDPLAGNEVRQRVLRESGQESTSLAAAKAGAHSVAKDGLELGVGFIPFVGTGVAVWEITTGTNIYGEEIGVLGRSTAAAGLIPGGKLVEKLGDTSAGLLQFAKNNGDELGSLAKKSDDAAVTVRTGGSNPTPHVDSAKAPVDDALTNWMRIQNKAQQARDTAPTRGLGGRSLTPAQRAELNTFADRARARGYVENPHRTGSFGEIVDGKFEERVRIDIGDPSQPGWRGKTHLNFPGDRGHYPPNTPLP